MGKFLVLLIVLAGGGYFAYDQGWIGDKGADSADGDGADGAEGGDGSGQTAGSGANGGAGDGGAWLSADLADAYNEAQSYWAEQVAAGKDPLYDVRAPELALTFSRVVRAGYGNSAGEAEAAKVLNAYLEPLSQRLFFSGDMIRDDPTGLFVAYRTTESNLTQVGRKFGISHEMIGYMRQPWDPDQHGDALAAGTSNVRSSYDKLSANEELKVIDLKSRILDNYRAVANGDQPLDYDHEEVGFFLHVDKSSFHMDLYVGGVLIRRFPIGIGAIESVTPVTRRPVVIDTRVTHTDWTHPETKEVMAWNDPNNILGLVWIRLDRRGLGQEGIGIHGYMGDGSATGVMGSNGCIRMRNGDAMLVHDLLTKVDPPSEGFLQRAPMWVEISE